ncbi:MAG TPA: cation diffusion facilitator family transporter [Rickettsiales bacterium]|nr:cation diffusion facilitator family transporter [Rickettsiales bacterium]
MHNQANHLPYAEVGSLMRRASLMSLIVGVTLVVLKGGAWLMSDSLSLMSSLADSMLDVMASTVNFIAIRYALRPPDDDHRFGHGKAEDLATLAQSTFICGSGGFLVIEGIKRLFLPEPVYNSSIGIAVMVVSIVMTFALVLYQRHVVRKTASSAIAADAMHYFSDFLMNIGVIVAIVMASHFGWKTADPLIALIIAGGLIHGAYHMGRAAFNNLMDREFSDAEREEIKRVVLGFPDISGLHDLRTRRAGIHGFIQFHLVFCNRDISLKQAHKISDNVEEALAAIYPHTEILIHQDPYNDG